MHFFFFLPIGFTDINKITTYITTTIILLFINNNTIGQVKSLYQYRR